MPGPLQSPTPLPLVTITSISTGIVPGYKQMSETGVTVITGMGHARAIHCKVSRRSGQGPDDNVTISISTMSPGVNPVKFNELPEGVPTCPVNVLTV